MGTNLGSRLRTSPSMCNLAELRCLILSDKGLAYLSQTSSLEEFEITFCTVLIWAGKLQKQEGPEEIHHSGSTRKSAHRSFVATRRVPHGHFWMQTGVVCLCFSFSTAANPGLSFAS